MQPIEFEGICYVLVQTNTYHPIANSRHDLIWYPEDGLSLLDRVAYQPYVKSVVTECPWIIATYDREHVRVWKERFEGEGDFDWRCPNKQTYGASVNSMTMSLLGVRQTMPSFTYDGGKAIDAIREKLMQQYKNARITGK